MYQKGQNTSVRYFPQDFQQAARWYRVAAEQGHMIAQVRLGQLYEDGDGVIQDGQQAVFWYRKAGRTQTLRLLRSNFPRLTTAGWDIL
jgi:TPR repeat protein